MNGRHNVQGVSIRTKNEGISPDKVEMLQACQHENKIHRGCFTLMATLMCCTHSAYQKMIWDSSGTVWGKWPQQSAESQWQHTCPPKWGTEVVEILRALWHGSAWLCSWAGRRKEETSAAECCRFLHNASLLREMHQLWLPYLCSSKRHLPISIIKQAVADKSNAVIWRA